MLTFFHVLMIDAFSLMSRSLYIRTARKKVSVFLRRMEKKELQFHRSKNIPQDINDISIILSRSRNCVEEQTKSSKLGFFLTKLEAELD